MPSSTDNYFVLEGAKSNLTPILGFADVAQQQAYRARADLPGPILLDEISSIGDDMTLTDFGYLPFPLSGPDLTAMRKKPAANQQAGSGSDQGSDPSKGHFLPVDQSAV
ncbi:MAG: hypothetical protein PF961_03350 [Planctomycetota bacterium]|jgi:hypothetical protein|nr:hypothetical protein [Planctomycetota bacterium]